MSFWSFIGDLLLVNIFRKLFSNKGDSYYNSIQPSNIHEEKFPDTGAYSKSSRTTNRLIDPNSPTLHPLPGSKRYYQPYNHSNYKSSSINNNTDIDELYDRLDELECQLYNCDDMSDRYDCIEDEIDLLQERIDELEDIESYQLMNDDSIYQSETYFNSYEDLDSYHNFDSYEDSDRFNDF